MKRLLPLFWCVWAPFSMSMDVDTEKSIFAVITHKGGIASGLAHDHFIHANKVTAQIDGDKIDNLALTLVFAVADLEVDEVTRVAKWSSKLKKLGIQKEPFTAHDEKRAQKIHKAMWGKDQLNRMAYPNIEARLAGIAEKAVTIGERTFAYELTVAVTIVGQTVNKVFGADIAYNEGVLNLEAAAAAQFTDFGIEPYSALLGAVSNQDRFYFYVNLTTK